MLQMSEGLRRGRQLLDGDRGRNGEEIIQTRKDDQCKDVRNISEYFGLFSYIYDGTAGHVMNLSMY